MDDEARKPVFGVLMMLGSNLLAKQQDQLEY